jgi:hypothetical protein
MPFAFGAVADVLDVPIVSRDSPVSRMFLLLGGPIG